MYSDLPFERAVATSYSTVKQVNCFRVPALNFLAGDTLPMTGVDAQISYIHTAKVLISLTPPPKHRYLRHMFVDIGLVGIGPNGSLWLGEALQAHPGSVDRAFTCEQEGIIKPASKSAAHERCDHRDLDRESG